MPTDFWEGDDQDQPPSNRLGTAGFVLSIFGIVTCGIMAPLGLVLSISALRKAPRDTAKAGLLISLVGCLFLAFVTVGIIQDFLAIQDQEDTLSRAIDLSQVLQQEQHLNEETGKMTLRQHPDLWGNEFRLTQLDGEFELWSAGADQDWDTDDDMAWIFPNSGKQDGDPYRKSR